MKLSTAVIVGIAIGYFSASHLYSTAFDPVAYWNNTKSIAKHSAQRACILGGGGQKKCEEIALKIYKELDYIGNQIDDILGD